MDFLVLPIGTPVAATSCPQRSSGEFAHGSYRGIQSHEMSRLQMVVRNCIWSRSRGILVKFWLIGTRNPACLQGHFRILDWRYLAYIRPIFQAYVSEYPHKIWPYMLQYLQFRILKWPLNASSLHSHVTSMENLQDTQHMICLQPTCLG
jgi:hypothetical protein